MKINSSELRKAGKAIMDGATCTLSSNIPAKVLQQIEKGRSRVAETIRPFVEPSTPKECHLARTRDRLVDGEYTKEALSTTEFVEVLKSNTLGYEFDEVSGNVYMVRPISSGEIVILDVKKLMWIKHAPYKVTVVENNYCLGYYLCFPDNRWVGCSDAGGTLSKDFADYLINEWFVKATSYKELIKESLTVS